MFHYRWYAQADADNAGTLLPLTMMLNIPEDAHRDFKKMFSERQIGRLYVVGSNDTTAPVIDASYRRFLAAMENHLANQKYMLGKRPAAGDFGLDLVAGRLAGSAELVTVFNVVHETPHPKGFLRECATVLQPRGRLLIVEPRGHVTDDEFERIKMKILDATD